MITSPPDRSRPSKRAAPKRRSWLQRSFYFSVRLLSQFIAVFVFNFRAYGRENWPEAGGGLVLSTHQSTLDPVLVGLSFPGRLNYLARNTLFDNRLFATIIMLLDAIALDRERGGLAGLKETMIRLKRGEKVLMFPEGTRSKDGTLGPLKPGFISVAKRTEVPLIPVAITGAFEVLPRSTYLPRRYPLRACIGPAIAPEEFCHLSDEEILQLVTQGLNRCNHIARNQR
ncbi:MAG: 1-acyl-sn-glycerol-3-phosphate acyltransferase [bacterium]|nr:1-acyl-sn-glycerol-3-phosphate acyltransferase [bacterium]